MIKDKLEQLTDNALDVLKDYLANQSPDENDSKKAKTAQSILSAFAKMEQTASARETTAFFVARELSEDKAQLARFLKIAAPQLTKGLPEPKAKMH